MNILIYDLEKNLQNLLSKLEQIKNVSIYFAYDNDEMKSMIGNIKPEIIFANRESINPHINEYLNRNLNIYTIDESKEISQDKIFLNKEVLLSQILNITNQKKRIDYSLDEKANG